MITKDEIKRSMLCEEMSNYLVCVEIYKWHEEVFISQFKFSVTYYDTVYLSLLNNFIQLTVT